MKKHDFGNSYEVEFLVELNISLVFNILDLKKYYKGGDGDEVVEAQWSILASTLATKEIEEILDSHVGRTTRNKTNEGYLIRWIERLVEDLVWLAWEEVDHLHFPLTI